MISLCLVGIGTGNPDHITRQGIAALNAADVILVPHKGAGKSDLAGLRLALCAAVVVNPKTRTVGFDMPVRDGAETDYFGAVDRWHDAIAVAWETALAEALPRGGRVALLVWGDPSLYDSTLRIAERLGRRLALEVSVVPGITALQALTAAHAVALNEINAPVTITTGRHLRAHGWPPGVATVAVLLDGECAFAALPPEGVNIWWGAYLGMPEQLCIAGALAAVRDDIVRRRREARAAHGWIMDTYLLRRVGPMWG
ncbi:MAG: hypothetical protein JWQ88_3917 [Rhodoferax sp.]|nr:hypothetical protein [Rhodoferax sp.]